MYKEQPSPAVLMVESPASASDTSTWNSESAAQPVSALPVLSAAITGLDPVSSSTLRHMLLQTGFVKDVQEWAADKMAQLRHSQDVADLIFLDLNGKAELDFTVAQQLTRLRPSVHIVACFAKTESNPDFLLQAMRSGVREALQKPFGRVELASLISRVSHDSSQAARS